MSIDDLNRKYDKLQIKYGAKNLNSIYNGGCTDNPDVMFIFMNPTRRNIASSANWKGRRYPWIGTKNIWKLFYNLNLLDHNLYDLIMAKKPSDWNEEFADLVYNDVIKKKYFITNLGKCTQIDARYLPDHVYKEYLNLLFEEINIVKPKKIITFGNQVSSIFLEQTINVSKCRKQNFKKIIYENEYNVYPIYYPIGNGLRNMDKAIEDLKIILKSQ